MQGENRFIKLLLFSTAGGEVLLYGFSSPTNQPFLTWKQREISKKHQSVLTAILPFHEAEIFEKSLTQESTLSMAKITMKSPQLVIRPMVLVNDTHSRQHGPVVEYAYLKELWNVQKEALFQEILHSFGTDGKELYRDVQDLIQWCQEECGIDFSHMAYLGDDFIDLEPMEAVGMPMAVANARPEALRAARYVTALRGGEGAVREAVEWLLHARGLNDLAALWRKGVQS